MLKVENLPCIGEQMGSFRGEGAKAMLKEIINLINENPNDADLGGKLRKYIKESILEDDIISEPYEYYPSV
jgi:hypothetical protein